MSHAYDGTSSKDENKDRPIVGPALPPHLLSPQSANEDSTSSASKGTQKPSDESYGPALPPNFKTPTSIVTKQNSESDDDDDYGPLPTGVSSNSLAQRALEERALQLKLDLLQGSKSDKAEVREEWMVELPEVGGAHLGLGPRKFRKNERPDFSDRSSWTDTPDLKAKKASGKQDVAVDLKKEAELREITRRNKEKDQLIAEYNKKHKRDKSLVELHQDKIKKQKTESSETTTRRPFSREIDLKVDKFDEAQKKSIMKKAMLLDDRFSRGKSKYL